jgi:D-3-phosphoglycerate dehydrogenase
VVPIKNRYYFIDFDSTFIQSEGLEELASVVLKNNPDKKSLLEKISAITTKAMEGKMPFDVSLEERLTLLDATKDNIQTTSELLKKLITPSIARNTEFFKIHKDSIYIISGGFKEFIMPVVTDFGISEDHVFANTFLFDKQGKVIGVDKKNPMAQEQGKVKVVKSLNLTGEKYIIGDGYTDYQLKKLGLVKEFIAFTENIERKIITDKADIVAPTFDEFLYINKLPMTVSYPKSRIKVMLLENINNNAVTIFEKEGYSVHYYEKSLPEDELKEKIKPVYILGVRSRTQLTKDILEHADRLLAIGSYGIGTNHMDLEYAAQKGISIFNAPYSSTRSVAELTIGEMIMLSRKTFEKSAKLHKGIWDKTTTGSAEVKGKTLGIIGYGTIGSHVGILAEALGMRVCFYDIVERPLLGNAQKCQTMEELLKISDIITVHVDGREQNRNLINKEAFHMMRNGVIFLNASRGFIVDIEALSESIKIGKIHGAAIDVFPKEPKSNDEPFVSPLQNLSNVILTPHIGAATAEAQKNIAQFVSEKVIDYINNGNTYLSVNLPNIQLPDQGTAHRLLHLHKNIPGILAKINNIFAQHNINILGQYLKTNESVGYVITDVDRKYDKEILNVLKQVPDTIRFRVLY